jgi:hypothetical protein
MNFVLYHTEFPHICNIYNINNIFYIDLWGFINDPLYLVYNSAEEEFHVLCIFHFEKPIRSQIDLRFLERHFFIGRSTMDLWRKPEAQKSTGGVPKHVGRATHALSVVDHPINLILSPTDVF